MLSFLPSSSQWVMPWCRCGVLLVLCVCPLACITMSPCPPGCCCPRPGFLVLCESLGLRSLPRSVPLSTSALSVARNQLCNVDHLLRPFSGLQELSLSHNLLARFPRGLPPSLESLLLQENRITYITSGALRQLGNLTRLDLEDNRIRAIQPGALQGLSKLQVLTLKGNRLTSLPLNLPPSLTHLDLSANCISALDLPSLSALVNLQVLKINSNCLRSVPESAFDALPRLRSVDLTNNLWVCECDILYLYRWLLSGRLKMATDLVCTEPVHLAHRLLLNLSVITICPRVLKPKERTHRLQTSTAEPTAPAFKCSSDKNFQNFDSLSDGLLQQISKAKNIHKDVSKSGVLLEHYSLETLSYEDCLTLNKTQTVSPSLLKTPTSLPAEDQKCRDNVTGRYSQMNTTSAEGTRSLLSTNRDVPLPTPNPRPFTPQDSVVISLLAVLCVLVALLMLAVSLILKKVLRRQQRVAPLDGGSGGWHQRTYTRWKCFNCLIHSIREGQSHKIFCIMFLYVTFSCWPSLYFHTESSRKDQWLYIVKPNKTSMPKNIQIKHTSTYNSSFIMHPLYVLCKKKKNKDWRVELVCLKSKKKIWIALKYSNCKISIN